LGSVWFFRFQAYKTETEPVGKILIGFFFTVRFFSDFLGLIGFRFFYSPLPRISITAFIRTEMKFSSICIFKNKTIHKKKKKKKKKFRHDITCFIYILKLQNHPPSKEIKEQHH
jgi:hypothetical protein